MRGNKDGGAAAGQKGAGKAGAAAGENSSSISIPEGVAASVGSASGKASKRSQIIGVEGLDPQIVLLDHGLYHDISDDLRSDFCKLVMACIRRDAEQTTKYSQRFAGETAISRFFPLILSPWFVFGTGRVTAAELKAANGEEEGTPPTTVLCDITLVFQTF